MVLKCEDSHTNTEKLARPSQAVVSGSRLDAFAGWLLGLPRLTKQSILLIADYLMSVLCLFFALALRHGTMSNHISLQLLATYASVPILGLYVINFYKGVTRIFQDANMRRVLQLFVVLIVMAAIAHALDLFAGIPRSVPAIYLFLFFIWLWNSRLTLRELLARWQGEGRYPAGTRKKPEKVIIFGAGAAGKELYEALQYAGHYQVVAFADDDPGVTGAHLLGKKIYHESELLALIKREDIQQVLIASQSLGRTRKRQLIESLSEISVKIKQLPSLHEIADGKVSVSTLRRVDILDVLDRQTVEPVQALLHQDITGKGVLVTGAGGSIGSELCRQILKNQPRCLVLYELSEYALYAIHQELQQLVSQYAEPIEIVALIGNVLNEDKLQRVFQQYQVETVYHAAAYKHVPIVEFNPFEGFINNTKGTYHCVRAAIAAQVQTFVLISTDKAVRPTNIMGASKRMAELVCQAFSQQSGQHTRISMVRFGNVLGSSGSVVPLFSKQIQAGGPITVTHPEVTRYFMTIPEAANLVIQAGAMAQGGEVFVLDMGEPVKIVDLARRMVHLSGCELKDAQNPEGDIEINFTGLRPGEKLYEELIIGDDNVESTQHPLIMQAMEHHFPLSDLETILSQVELRTQQHDVGWLKQQFRKYVVGYTPTLKDT